MMTIDQLIDDFRAQIKERDDRIEHLERVLAITLKMSLKDYLNAKLIIKV